MANISYKRSKDGKRVYAVLQQSYRDPATGKPKTKYIRTLGRTDGGSRPARPPKRVTLRDIVTNLLMGGAALGGNALLGKLGPPGGTPHKDTHRPPDPRSQAAERELWLQKASADPKAAIADIQARARAGAGKGPAYGVAAPEEPEEVMPEEDAVEEAAPAEDAPEGS